MKKQIIYLISCIALLSSCKEEIPTSTTGEEIQFSLLSTKATDNALEIGDEVGVYITDASASLQASGNWADNKKFIVTAKGLEPATDSDKLFFPFSGEVSYYIYYPYSAAVSNAKSLVLTANADFMWAKGTGKSRSNIIPINLSHRLSLIEVICPKNISAAKLLQKNGAIQCNLENGELTKGEVSDINLFKKSENASSITYRVLLPEQQILTETPLFSFTIDGIQKTYKAKSNVILSKGSKTVFNINIEYKINTSCSTKGTVIGGGIYQDQAVSSVTATPTTGYVFNGWYENDVLVSSASTYSFTANADRNLVAKFGNTTINYDLSVSPSTYTFVATGGSKSFTVVCNKTTKSYVEDVLVNNTTQASTEYTTYVTGAGFTINGNKVTAADNNSTDMRSGTFSAIVAGITKSVSIDQEGKIAIDTNINP